MKRLIIAIDGPSGAGKSTAGKALASRLGYLYIDTGAMYRAAALTAIKKQIPLDDELQIAEMISHTEIDLKGEPQNLQVLVNQQDVTNEIRTPEVSQAASIISAINGVRRALVDRQREMGRRGGVVMDGRDIGTHVFVNADVKFFLVADVTERARRRNLEEIGRGEQLSLAQTLQEIAERDERDSKRTYSPLRPAEDSIQLNTSNLQPAEVINEMMTIIERKCQTCAKQQGAN